MWRVKNSKTSSSLAICKKLKLIYKKLKIVEGKTWETREKKNQHKKFQIQKEEDKLLFKNGTKLKQKKKNAGKKNEIKKQGEKLEQKLKTEQNWNF
jgi:hypothetical protein